MWQVEMSHSILGQRNAKHAQGQSLPITDAYVVLRVQIGIFEMCSCEVGRIRIPCSTQWICSKCYSRELMKELAFGDAEECGFNVEDGLEQIVEEMNYTVWQWPF